MPKKRTKAKTLGDFIILTAQQIGKGSFATVYRGFRRADRKTVAIKVISRSKLTEKLLNSVQFEIDTLRKIKHPNIIRLFDFKLSQSSFYLIMECCDGGDLAAYIKKKGPLGEAVTRRFLKHLALGLQALHKEQIVHRDLKPQNLLLSEESDNAILKIADFGFARAIEEKQMAETQCGSPLYMGPEVLHGNRYDASADLWSVGAILYEMITGKPPYVATSIPHLMQIIKDKKLEYPEPGTKCGKECIDLMQRLLKPNPRDRISFEDFFNHPFLQMDDDKNKQDGSFVSEDDSFMHLNVPRAYTPSSSQSSLKKLTPSSPTERNSSSSKSSAEDHSSTSNDAPKTNGDVTSNTSANAKDTSSSQIPSKPSKTKPGISPFREESYPPRRVASNYDQDTQKHPSDNSFTQQKSTNRQDHLQYSRSSSSGTLPLYMSNYSGSSSYSPSRSLQLSQEGRSILEQNLKNVQLEDLINKKDMSSANFQEVIFDFSRSETDQSQLDDIELLEARAKRSWAMAEAAYLWNAQCKYVQSLLVYTKSIELLYNTYLKIQQMLNVNCDRIVLLCMWIQHRFSEFLNRTDVLKNTLVQMDMMDSEADSGESYIFSYILKLAKEGAMQEFLSNNKQQDSEEGSKQWLVMYRRCRLLLDYLYRDRCDDLNREDKDQLEVLLDKVEKAILTTEGPMST